MKTKIAYAAASIVALTVPVMTLTAPMTGCGSNTAATTGVTPTEGGTTVGETGTPTGETGTPAPTPDAGPPDAPPGTTLVPLVPSSTGYIMNAVTGITGAWYAYGDGWGTEGVGGATGVAGERGNCELIGGFPVADCSSITSPAPSAPQPEGGTVAADAAPAADATTPAGDAAADTGAPASTTDAAVASSDAGGGYDNGFPPSATGAMCLTGIAAKVIANDAGTDYSDIYGIGIGLDFNNVGGVKGPYDATLNKVVGVQFTIAADTPFPPTLRVEFPTEQTVDGGPNPTGDSYDVAPTAGGTVTVLWSQFAGPPVVGTDLSYPPTVDGGLAAQPAFDPTNLLSIQFHVATQTTGAIPVNNLCVTSLSAIVSAN